ncbi:2-hydroxyacid dehydrogenase, partial [Cutaneotrichosporon oleaginosum]
MLAGVLRARTTTIRTHGVLALARWSSTAAKPRVLMLDPINLAKAELAKLEQEATLIPLKSSDRSSFINDLRGEYDGITGIYRHFKGTGSINVTGRFDEELVSALPPTLRFITSNGAGYDQISVEPCSARNIQVSNVPFVTDNPTADTATFLLLSVLRQFPKALSEAQAGSFHKNLPLSNDPHGKVLGILGMGGIGRAFAKRARALGMTVQYHNRNRLPEDLEQGAKYVSRDELLATSDVVSLNLPLNAHTRHTISAPELKAMKKSAILINTARGAVVDEPALIEALEAGEIAGAGLDVYENEPVIPARLLQHPTAVCLPHIGTLSFETQKEMEAFCIRNLIAGLETGYLANVVSEQKGM